MAIDFQFIFHFRAKYEVSTLKIVQDSTNTRDLDKKFVQTPRTQPGYVGKFSIFIVVLIFLFTFQNVNNKIKTTTENLPTQAGCVPGIPTDFWSKSLVFVESCTFLNRTGPTLSRNTGTGFCKTGGMNIKEGQDMKKHMYLLVCIPHIVECT